MPDIGAPELLIIALIVLLLFGSSKLTDVGGSLGRSIREFRKATQEEDEPTTPPAPAQPAPVARAQDSEAQSPDGIAHFCGDCGAGINGTQKFCGGCGALVASR